MAAHSVFLCLLCIFATAIVVLGQSQAGYISIDCGSPPNINYIDTDTSISYTSDGAFIDTGVNMNVSAEYGYPANPVLPFPLADVRAFPQGKRNCYSLNPADGKGSLYLIRASFMYGNYDGENKLPEFDLYVNVNFWSSVRFGNASENVIREVISFAELDTIYVCLVNKGMGTPFISALELRPLNSSIYATEFGRNASLVLYQRWDTGFLNGTERYRDDLYDRIWLPHTSVSWASTLASGPVDIHQTGYRPPLEVIKTAVSPVRDTDPLELKWTSDDPSARFYAYLYFAELKALTKNEKREIEIFWNGSPISGTFVPLSLVATTISNSRAFTGTDHLISIHKTTNSTLPPILNAIEIFIAQPLNELSTAIEDVAAIESARWMYQGKKTWTGDPCSPRQYTWEGLECSYDNSLPRIISINLSSSGLTGPIALSIGNLSLLESLDLSNNNLNGPVPAFWDDLQHLKFLNLKGNKLTGFIPESLMKRSKARVLTLSADDQNICRSSSCKDNNNVIVPAVVATLVFILLIILVIGLVLQRQRKAEAYSGPLLPSSKRKFSSTEVSNITSNYQNVIGKGGFGVVYLGRLKNGTEVAVKLINDTSSSEKSQGSSSSRVSKEFQVEAELLLTVHHRNLASFVGYCDDGRKMALIYEYMSNGNLQDYLSGNKAENLSWEMRLRVALDAAQGLEYLHHGCKPPIIHRDVKTANILLSEELDAKIADFGLSKVFPADDESHIVTTVMGTPGYVDPEYYSTFKLNEKSDVYSFGIVLLELITGQPAIMKTDDGDKINIIHFVEPYLESGDINNAVDHRLRRDSGFNSACKYVQMAMWCTRERGSQRPTMNQIVAELKHCLAMELAPDRQHQRYIMESKMEQSYGRKGYDLSGSISHGYEDYSAFGPTAR